MKFSSDNEVIVREIIKSILQNQISLDSFSMPVRVSNRHVHLSRSDLEALFGPGYQLHPMRELSQKGYFAAQETVILAGPQGTLNKVRVLGPLRKSTQIELLLSDSTILGIELPVRESGTVDASPSITMIGPRGTIVNHTGVMAAWRHIHMNTRDALQWGLKEGDTVKIQTRGDRSMIFEQVRLRISDAFTTELHLDVDEANAAAIKNGDAVQLLI